jgi:aspartyl-tRNA(Asn)/glutamyl-tRNA(Gln) amidotransferase subunit C
MDRKDVAKTAALARLKLTSAELDMFTEQLADLLDYVHVLNEVDTDNVEPMAHVVELANVFRKDEPRQSLSRDDALANAPKTDGKYFLVPKILEES